MYFETLPKTYYSLDDGNSTQIITNIFLRYVFSDEVKNNLTLYELYDIVDGDTPEIVSDRFYSRPDYHWIILHLNEIIDPRFGWPLSTYNLQKYCEGKYANINAIHHYVNSDGFIVNSNAPGAVPVSNFQYEEGLNEAKRTIKILKPVYLRTVIDNFQTSLGRLNG
jgi:hypothetical protein